MSEKESMDRKALKIVSDYAMEHLDVTDDPNVTVDFNTFIVWKCKTLQNWKWLVSTTLHGMYYEVTYNGDKQEFYLDAYKKFENRCIPEEGDRLRCYQ